MYFVYVLRCSDNSLYTGITTDFKKRFEAHVTKDKLAAKYTRSRNVVCAEAVWIAPDKSSALKLEARIKSLSKAKKEALIRNPDSINSLGLEAEYKI